MEAHGYAPPNALAENLWEIRGEWSNKFGRRMTIVRLTDGDVFIHSAIRLEPSDLSWLKSLGPVRGIVAPNKFHCSDAPWMAREFPEATLYVPQCKLRAFASLGLKPSDLASEFPTDIRAELECVPMKGTRIDESSLIHHGSRTLIMCDLAMNMEDVFTGIQGAFMRWNGVGGRFGVTRLTKLLFTSDKKALVESYRRVLDHDFNRVVVSHGAVLEDGGHERLEKAVGDLFGVPFPRKPAAPAHEVR